MPFEDDEAELKPKAPRRGVKLDNVKSAVQPKAVANPDFDKDAKEAFERTEEYKERAFELGKQFKRIIEDKTLPANKGHIGQGVESEALQKLIQLGIEMNVDETQLEGMGSMGINTLLLKGLIMQRDRINVLEHVLQKIEKSIQQIQSRVEQGDKPK